MMLSELGFLLSELPLLQWGMILQHCQKARKYKDRVTCTDIRKTLLKSTEAGAHSRASTPSIYLQLSNAQVIKHAEEKYALAI